MILLTGFEPFVTGQGLVLSHNPTADIVERISLAWPETEQTPLISQVLPVSFKRTKEALLRQFSESRPRIWCGLGYAPHRHSVDVEVVALNIEHAVRGDNDGDQPCLRTLIQGAPLAYETRLAVDIAVETFGRHGVDAKASTHAGTFLCNQVFYLGCHACETGHLDMAFFIHVPPMDDYKPFEVSLTQLLRELGFAPR